MINIKSNCSKIVLWFQVIEQFLYEIQQSAAKTCGGYFFNVKAENKELYYYI